LRLLGAVLALLWGALMFVVVGHNDRFLVFSGLLFFGVLLAGYIARASERYGYAGLQMGLVVPLLVVVPPNEFGNVDSVIARLEGVACAIVATLIVGGLWQSVGSPPAAGASAN
jgi:uncharacterized membrane protein YccC